jgi:LysM repeat protein
MIFAVHIIVLGGILMVGCKDTSKVSSTPRDVADNSPMTPTSPDPYTATTGPVPLPPAPGSPAAPVAPLPQAPTPTSTALTQTTVPPVPPTIGPAPATPREASDYTIASGDTMDALHKKFNVSTKAIEDANPGLDPKKMQIGYKLHIPAGTAVAAAPAPARATGDTAPAPAASGDTTSYVIKSGDVLMKIARAHNTTVKAIQDLNGMKTSAIQAGHTIKLPVTRMASAEAPASPAAPVIPAAPATSAAPVRSF